MHPACALTQCIATRQILIGATAKRMLVGTLAPGAVWRKHDALNFARMLAFVNEIPMSHTFVEAIRGSPWINMLGRLRGTRIGRDAFIDTLAVNDYDLPQIGDRAVIARNATIFCHLGARKMPHPGKGRLVKSQCLCQTGCRCCLNTCATLPERMPRAGTVGTRAASGCQAC